MITVGIFHVTSRVIAVLEGQQRPPDVKKLQRHDETLKVSQAEKQDPLYQRCDATVQEFIFHFLLSLAF